MQRSEIDKIKNTPIQILEVKPSHDVQVRALPMLEALAWCERAKEVESNFQAAQKPVLRESGKMEVDNAAIKAACEAVMACIIDYDDNTRAKPDLIKSATMEQILAAFRVLSALNDPLEISREAQMAQVAAFTRQFGEQATQKLLAQSVLSQQTTESTHSA